jgi:hypothetical protein
MLAGETSDWDIGRALGATMELQFYDRFHHSWSADIADENGTSISVSDRPTDRPTFRCPVSTSRSSLHSIG